MKEDSKIDIKDLVLTDEDLSAAAAAAIEDLKRETDEYVKNAAESLAENADDRPNETLMKALEKLDKKHIGKKKVRIANRILRSAAVFLLCFAVVGGIGLGTSEAVRNNVLSLFKEPDSKIITIQNEASVNFEEIWDGHWQTEYVPEGFELVKTENSDLQRFMVFKEPESGAGIMISVITAKGYSIDLDTEHTKVEEIKIGNYKGFFTENSEHGSCGVIWQTDSSLMQIDTVNYADKTELMKVAEGIKYVK